MVCRQTGKVSHTKKEANKIMKAQLDMGSYGLNVYPCKHCKGHHIGHYPGPREEIWDLIKKERTGKK